MKDFFKKNDLLKVAGILVLFAVLITWLIPQGYHNGTEFVSREITRVGIFDFFTYGVLGIFYFPVMIVFIFILGGFYQVLSKTKGYQNITSYIAKKFKGVEIVFILLVSFLIAALTTIINDIYVVVTFIPFFISIMSKMKLPKMTGFTTTFGSLFIGIMGAVYSSQVVGENIKQLSVTYDHLIWYKLSIFAIAFILFSVLNVTYLKRKLGKKDTEVTKELFETKVVSKSKKTWPVAVIFGIFALIGIIAYMPWQQVFNVTIFSDITTNIKEFLILDEPLFGYILGGVEPFGKWELVDLLIVMVMITLVIKVVCKISFDDYLTAFGEGLQKVAKFAVLILASFLIVEFAFMFPVLPTITDWIMTRVSDFNAALAALAGLVTGLFSSEYQYFIVLFGSYISGAYSAVAKETSLLMQSTYGIMGLITPASAMLLVGLSYLNISYRDWFKYIWKFLVLMIVVVTIFTFHLTK